jgi:enoyl-[acyl-carrier protein] reductase II
MQAKEGDTELTLKKLTPVRMLKNELYQKLNDAIQQNSSPEQLREILGKGRAKRGILEGDLVEGELEIGQISALLKDIKPVQVYMNELIEQYLFAQKRINNTEALAR